MAHDVFISHSKKDKAVADAVCSALESGQHRCWIAPRDVLPGADWGSAIVEAIKTARVMVLIFSSDSNDSDQVRREVQTAASNGVAILPFRIEDVKPSTSLEYFLGAQHWLDAMTPPMEGHLKRLREVVGSLLAKSGPAPAAAAASPETPIPATPPAPSTPSLLSKIAWAGGGVLVTLLILVGFSLLRGGPADEATPTTESQPTPQQQTRTPQPPTPVAPPPRQATTAPPTPVATTPVNPGEGEALAEPESTDPPPEWDPGEPPPARTLQFPDRGGGSVFVRPWGSDDEWEDLADAEGIVKVPEGREVKILCFRGGYPESLLDNLKPQDIQAFLLSWNDADLVNISRFTATRELNLISMNFSGDGLLYLRGMVSLETLDLHGTSIQDEELQYLAPLESLRNIDISSTGISDEGLALIATVTSLRRLELDQCKSISDAGLEHLGKLTSLVYLDLSFTLITDVGLKHLHGLSSLRELKLTFTRGVTREGVQEARIALPQCRIVR